MGIFSLFRNTKTSLQESGVLSGLCDIHTHILPGVDDGVKTMEQSLEILAYMESLGVNEIWCTPHVMDDIPNQTDDLKTRFAQLQEAYQGPIKLNLAAEYMLDSEFENRLEKDDLESCLFCKYCTYNGGVLICENEESRFFKEQMDPDDTCNRQVTEL